LCKERPWLCFRSNVTHWHEVVVSDLYFLVLRPRSRLKIFLKFLNDTSFLVAIELVNRLHPVAVARVKDLRLKEDVVQGEVAIIEDCVSSLAQNEVRSGALPNLLSRLRLNLEFLFGRELYFQGLTALRLIASLVFLLTL